MLPNVTFLMGRICSAKMRQTNSGSSVINARMAVADGSDTFMIDVVFWSDIALRAQKLIDFDEQPNLVVVGSLQQDKWTHGETGEPRTKLSIKVKRFFVLADIGDLLNDEDYHEEGWVSLKDRKD